MYENPTYIWRVYEKYKYSPAYMLPLESAKLFYINLGAMVVRLPTAAFDFDSL